MSFIDSHCHVLGPKDDASFVCTAAEATGVVNINYAEDGNAATLAEHWNAISMRMGLADHVRMWCVAGIPGLDYFRWPELTRLSFLQNLRCKLNLAHVIGVKIWKDVGMVAKDREGAYAMPDDPFVDAIIDVAQSVEKAVFLHLGDPIDAWLPEEQRRPDARKYYHSHPQFDMTQVVGAPTHQQLMDARERLIARWPRVRFVVCHLGYFPCELRDASEFLVRHQNVWMDTAGRLATLRSVEQSECKRFFEEHCESLMFGTDWTPSGDGAVIRSRGISRYHEWREFFESTLSLSSRCLNWLYTQSFEAFLHHCGE